jgi:thymidylate kinase
MLVALEGIDACGKNTQSRLLAKKMNAAHMAFPNYDTVTGQMIQQYLRDFMWVNPKLHAPYVFQALQTVNRLECYGLIESLRRMGKNIVFDRFDASAYVYGGADGVDPDWLCSIQVPVEIDHRILLDVNVNTSFDRRPERRDKIERNGAYLADVRARYLTLFNKMRRLNYKGEQPRLSSWHIVDGNGTVDEVHARVCAAIGV